MTEKQTAPEQPLAVARPNLYIDVIINNQKTVYPIDVARQLHAQLEESLRAIDAMTKAPEAQEEVETVEETEEIAS